MKRFYWLSSQAMTIEVTTEDRGYNNQRTVVSAPPIAKKFEGQSLGNLVRWMMKQGGFQMKELSPEQRLLTAIFTEHE